MSTPTPITPSGATLRGLLKIASEMSASPVDADRRRDMAQWMQRRLIRSVKTNYGRGLICLTCPT